MAVNDGVSNRRFMLPAGPVHVAFSGGRTSAYMIYRILEANDGLRDQVAVVFCNTGKEMEATLAFVRDVERNWGVPITWLEWRGRKGSDRNAIYEQVTFDSASRNGEPFEALIREKRLLPNPVARICTQNLKVFTSRSYLMDLWNGEEYDTALGLRADEPRRVANMRRPHDFGHRGGVWLPLVDAGVSAQEVQAFWSAQSFDLALPAHNGVSTHGNCDLCFLKGEGQIRSLIAEKKERADWWVRMESIPLRDGRPATFRKDRPAYRELQADASASTDLFGHSEGMLGCYCGD